MIVCVQLPERMVQCMCGVCVWVQLLKVTVRGVKGVCVELYQGMGLRPGLVEGNI